jgi:hypothetical protein
LRLTSFGVKDVPLDQFLHTLSEIANVAITLDPEACELAGVSVHQSVSASGNDTTINQLLTTGLAKTRLEFAVAGGQVKLELGGDAKRRAVDYDVADLVDNDGGKQLVRLIQQLIAPESWQTGGGTIEVNGEKLRVDHSQQVRHQVLIFCERLRIARSLPLRSRYPAELLSIEPAYQAIAAKLGEKTTFTILPWSRMTDVVGHWQSASGITVLVDWAALADRNLGPSSSIACSANDRTWGDVLDKSLEPIELTWWPVNKDTIQITTSEAVEDVRRIEFYAIPKALREQFASNDALIETLQNELQESQAAATVLFDYKSDRLVVLGAPAAHRALSSRLSE